MFRLAREALALAAVSAFVLTVCNAAEILGALQAAR